MTAIPRPESQFIIDVHGTPGAQGSKRHVGHGIMIESSAKVKPWRMDVKAAAEAAQDALGPMLIPFDGPLEVRFTFRFHRPRGHYGTGRNQAILKPSAPAYPTSRALGDVSKLVRSTEDALTDAGVIADDSLIVTCHAAKRWCTPGERQGCRIVVREAL